RVDDRQVVLDVVASDGDTESGWTIALVLRVTVEVGSGGDRNRGSADRASDRAELNIPGQFGRAREREVVARIGLAVAHFVGCPHRPAVGLIVVDAVAIRL